MSFVTLSVSQLDAWLIIRPDIAGPVLRARAREEGQFKDIVNQAEPAVLRGWILVHADGGSIEEGQTSDCSSGSRFARGVAPPPIGPLRGVLLGLMRIDDCVTCASSRWFTGPCGLVIGDSVAFTESIACPASHGFFLLPGENAGIIGEAVRWAIHEQLCKIGFDPALVVAKVPAKA